MQGRLELEPSVVKGTRSDLNMMWGGAGEENLMALYMPDILLKSGLQLNNSGVVAQLLPGQLLSGVPRAHECQQSIQI